MENLEEKFDQNIERQELPTKAVKAVIENEKGEMLLLQRNPKTRDKANWDLAGGLIEDGESETIALLREVTEELSVSVEIFKKGGAWSFFRPKDKKVVDVQNYHCRIISGDIVLSDEHVDYKWVDKKDVEKYPVKDESFYSSLD